MAGRSIECDIIEVDLIYFVLANFMPVHEVFEGDFSILMGGRNRFSIEE